MSDSQAEKTREGVLYALAAYGWWGLVPLYFKALAGVPPLEQLAHRIVWSIFFLALLLYWLQRFGELFRVLRSRPDMIRLGFSTVLIAVNWFVFIYGVAIGQVVQNSLGYFINPLVNILLGMLVLGERLRRLQWLAVGFATSGVLAMIYALGELPWISLTLGVSFALYGLLRKQTHADGLVGLTIEVVLLLPLTVGYLGWLWSAGQLALGSYTAQLDVLLLGSGVITAIPLMCYGQAARRLPLWLLGILQYISPSIQLMLAVVVFQEDFDLQKLMSFALIWVALALCTVDSLLLLHRRARMKAAVKMASDTSTAEKEVSAR